MWRRVCVGIFLQKICDFNEKWIHLLGEILSNYALF